MPTAKRLAPSQQRTLPMRVMAYGIYLSIYLSLLRPEVYSVAHIVDPPER